MRSSFYSEFLCKRLPISSVQLHNILAFMVNVLKVHIQSEAGISCKRTTFGYIFSLPITAECFDEYYRFKSDKISNIFYKFQNSIIYMNIL